MSTPPPAIPKGLLDSSPSVAVLLELAEAYARRALPPAGVDSEIAFASPRSQLQVRTCVRGTTIGTHWHSTVDEIVVVVGGRGELLVDGVWRPVERGALHVCPRGVVHDTRALDEHLRFLSIFTPHPPPGGDINWVPPR
ncbi:MAG: cupin domain-containing protein [Anaeromyxobacteraceae bacterium]|nr:cupin domain-containing protein [Anaeromyxobacteraceae bacterium]